MVEILVIGNFTLTWIVLLLLRTGVADLAALASARGLAKDLPELSVIASLAILYQLGWAMNWISHLLFARLTNWDLRRKVLVENDSDYAHLKTAAFQNASLAVMNELQMNKSLIRLTRSAALNFALTGIIAVSYLSTGWVIGGSLSLLFAALCGLHARHTVTWYYEKLRTLSSLSPGGYES